MFVDGYYNVFLPICPFILEPMDVFCEYFSPLLTGNVSLDVSTLKKCFMKKVNVFQLLQLKSTGISGVFQALI